MKYLFVFIFVLFTSFLNAQTPTYIGGKISPGVILKTFTDVRYIVDKPITELNIFVGYQTTGKQDWQQYWSFPEIGFAFHYADLGNPDILGHSTAAYLYYDAPFFRGKILSFNYFVGFGASYLSKPFDYKTNYLNIANGSHLNVFLNFNAELQIRTKRIVYFSDFGLTHYSNAGTKSPNLGLNLIAGSVGIKYKLKDFSRFKKTSVGTWKKYTDFQIVQSAFVHSDKLSVSHPAKFISSFYMDYGVYISPKSRFGLGFNLMYDADAENHFIVNDILDSKPMDYVTGGVFLSYHAVFGNIQVIGQQIFFIRKKYSKQVFMHQRFAIRLLVTDNLSVGIGLMANFLSALTLEPSIGYRFH